LEALALSLRKPRVDFDLANLQHVALFVGRDRQSPLVCIASVARHDGVSHLPVERMPDVPGRLPSLVRISLQTRPHDPIDALRVPEHSSSIGCG
jgi:hypothetical protein